MSRRSVVLGTSGAVAAVVALVVLVVVTAGQGGSSSGGRSGVSRDSAAAGSAPAAGAVAPAEVAAPGSTSQAAATAGREVVRTARLSVTADDPDAAAERADAVATAAGGRVDTDTRADDAHLVLRVPADRLDATLSQLAALGDETSREVQGDDVTATTADLDARVSALETSVDRLRGLIATAGSLADLLSVESQLTERQSELESLQAQQRALADQVALATVDLDLVAPTVTAATSSGPSGFGDAVAGGWHGFTVVVRGVLAAVGYTLPFLVLALLLVAGLLVVRGRRRVVPAPPASSGD